MKTTLRNIAIAIGLTAILGSATLSAQNGSKASIPFDFQITGTTLPSGDYTVRLDNARHMLTFQNLSSGRSASMLAHPFASGTKEDPMLVFRHNGERYTLESAWFAGVSGGYGPLKGKRDRSDNERGMVATVRLLQK
jgi:hypothetical protein